jgi:hypothetical protein
MMLFGIKESDLGFISLNHFSFVANILPKKERK